MSKMKVIINPSAGHGYTRRVSPVIGEYLQTMGVPFDLVHTSRQGEAIEIARQAVADGFERIIAVGGDGTSHEVVNGLMSTRNGHVNGLLGCIPTGSGNDFAVMNGIPTDLRAACQLVVEGKPKVVDVGRVTIDGHITRYFDNTIGVGFDGLVVKETKRLKNLRGIALYLPAVLKTIFVSMRPPKAKIVYDGNMVQTTTLMTVVSNGPREGGAFLVAPNARCDDGLFDIVIAGNMSKLEMLAMIPRFLKGTHLTHRMVSLQKARNVVISSEDPLHIHVDGEIICDEAHHLEVEIIPQVLPLIAPPNNQHA